MKNILLSLKTYVGRTYDHGREMGLHQRGGGTSNPHHKIQAGIRFNEFQTYQFIVKNLYDRIMQKTDDSYYYEKS